jgi:pyruvate kinase
MIIVSNYLFSKSNIKFPEDVVARVNIAWIKNVEELKKALNEIKHDVYLDYPQGRTKPPLPTISLIESLALVHHYKHVKYFAVSNVEDPNSIGAIKDLLPKTVQLVPKIETQEGIRNLEAILSRIKAKFIMLDKEDLYLDANRDNSVFENLVNEARQKCLNHGVTVLELHGVVFMDLK